MPTRPSPDSWLRMLWVGKESDTVILCLLPSLLLTNGQANCHLKFTSL